MAPLSPVLTNFYANHANHHQLATQEPLLCCTILMISSRHHALPGAGGASRSYFIHDRFWKYCQHFISRLIYGQEKGSTAKTRTLGSIEALLLLSEWHPRSLHFPSESDGWDSDLIPSVSDVDENEPSTPGGPSNKWLEDVVEPARRSDRMSWMLLGCALSLAHELDVFDDDRDLNEPIDESTSVRTSRVKRLLFVFVNQLASRLGKLSMLPQNLTYAVINEPRSRQSGNDYWDTFMCAWTDLTKLNKSLSEQAFQSKAATQQLLRSGRYVGLLELFQPLLGQWQDKYLDNQGQSTQAPSHHQQQLTPSTDIPSALRDVLFIEYQYARVYTNSIGMQAVCERAFAEQTLQSKPQPLDSLSKPFDACDQSFIQEVISASCDMLEKVISLAETNTLRFAPVRVFLRITASSVFLLKAMSIGIRNDRLRPVLHVLHRSVHALRHSVLDDMHLATSYAGLLETHINRLQKGFSSKRVRPSRPVTRRPSVDGEEYATAGDGGGGGGGAYAQQFQDDNVAPEGFGQAATQTDDWLSLPIDFDGTSTGDWLSLPFDPAMAPFGPTGAAIFPAGLDDDGLNFIWNLPT